MKSFLPLGCLCILATSGATISRFAVADEAASTALADYVAAADDSYRWVKRQQGQTEQGAWIELTLTSQTWRDIPWRHQLFVFKPAKLVDKQGAVLVIGGGRWSDELAQDPGPDGAPLPRESLVYVRLAEQTGSCVAVLLHVPQQPIFDGMVEDEIISYTFAQFLRTRDPSWPLLLPMVKSAVRGMDAVTQAAAKEWQLELEQFTLTGASKRGWTTWLTGAIDPRVACLAPMVIDVLNMQPQMKHQLATWGKYSEEIGDYTQRGIQSQTATEAGKLLNSIIDPYNYRQDIEQPKLILLGTNDRYWPLDALNLYWDGLEGEKHVVYCPNQGHGLRDLDRVVGGIAALHRQSAGRLALPKLTWETGATEDGLSLSLSSDATPTHVRVWTATAPTRDFRDATWASTELSAEGDGWTHRLEAPEEGCAAMFGEAEFLIDGLKFFLSTNVRITPPLATQEEAQLAEPVGAANE